MSYLLDTQDMFTVRDALRRLRQLIRDRARDESAELDKDEEALLSAIEKELDS